MTKVLNIKSHVSLLVMLLGAGSFLLSNILLKEILKENDYGKYSIVVTYISMVYLFGLLGFEQVFVRFSKGLEKNMIQTQKIQLHFIIAIATFTSIAYSIIYILFFQQNAYLNPILLFVSTYGLTISPILFNIFRLNNQFSLSQIVQNGWKIGFALVVILFFGFKINYLQTLNNALLSITIIFILISIIIIAMKIKFVFNYDLTLKKTAGMFLMFFVSISSFSIVMFADRFIIESKLGAAAFGDYFYLINLVLAPFSILQSYVGFKQVVYFKESFSLDIFKKFNRQILFLALSLSLGLVILIFVLMKWDILNFNFYAHKSIIFLLLLLGIIRLHSSSILPAFEVKTSYETLKKANIIVIIFTIVISFSVIYFANSLSWIIIGFILIWLCRSLTYRYLLIKQITTENTPN